MEMVALSTGISMAYLCQMILSDARANLTWRANAAYLLCRREVTVGNALKFVC